MSSFLPIVELCSGIDALYLSAQGTARASLFADLEAARCAAEAAELPVDCTLGGYSVKVKPHAPTVQLRVLHSSSTPGQSLG